MPDAIADLMALVGGGDSGGRRTPIDDLRAMLDAPSPTTRATSPAPTDDELAIIRGAPPNRPPTGLTPESIPSPDTYEPPHPIDAAFKRTVVPAVKAGLQRANARMQQPGPTPFVDAIDALAAAVNLPEPSSGVSQMGRGARNLLRAGVVAASPDQPAWGAPARPAFGATPPEGGAMGAASDIIEGAMTTAQPLMVAGGIEAPLVTAGGLGTGMAGQHGFARGATALGASPEAARLAGNIGGLVAGGVGGAAAHGAPSLMEALRRGPVEEPAVAPTQPVSGVTPEPEVSPAIAPQEPPPALQRPAQPPPIEGVPVEEPPSSPVEELANAVFQQKPDAGSVLGGARPGDAAAGADLGARDTEPQELAGPRPAPEPGQPQAEPPAPQEAVPDVGAPGPPETAGVQVAPDLITQERQRQQALRARQDELLAAEGQAPPSDVPDMPDRHVSELSPEHVGELRRITHELDAMPFTAATYNDVSGDYGKTGNFGVGNIDKRGRAGGASVFNDVYEIAPGTSRATRAAAQDQLERYLAGGKPTNFVKGAIEIARARMEGKTRIPGDGPLSTPELSGDVRDLPTRLEPKPEGPEPVTPLEDQGDLAEGIGPEEEPGSLDDWFSQQAEAERGAPAEASVAASPVDELADAIKEPPPEDLLDTGEAQTRLPGDVGAVRETEAAQPEFEAPFSLSGEAAPDTATQGGLFAPEKPTFGEKPRYGTGGRYAEEGGTTLQSTILPGAQEFMEQDVVPAAKRAAQLWQRAADDIRRTFMPESRSDEAGITGNIVRQRGGELAHRAARAEYALRDYGAQFDKLPHPADPRADVGVQVMMALEAGDYTQMPPEFVPAAKAIRALLDNRRRQVQARGRLQQAIKDYFPHIWEDPEKAKSVFADWNARRPLEGSKAFLKKRSIDSISDGLDAGLVPVSRNPVTMALLKVREMDKFITAHDALQRMKEQGVAKYVPVGQAAPDGWIRIADPIGTVFKNPNIPVSEAYDASTMEGLSAVAKDLGITHAREMNVGGGKLGYSEQGGNRVVTKFATPDNVLAHEIGHQIDYKFKLWDKLKQLEQQYKAQGYDDWSLRKQLRAVTDLTWEGKDPGDVSEGFRKYVRKKEEQIANMVEAYVHVPDKFKQLAPDVFNVFDELVDTTPALAKLRDVKPSMRLGVREDTVHAGGAVIGGHYWAPADGAQLLNQHLAPGLAGNAVYDVYKAVGNNITSVKLGLSGFHAAVESVNAILSKASLALKYGLPESMGGEGKPMFALKKLGEAPIAPVVDYLRGKALQQDYLTKPLTGDPTQSMVDAVVQAGGRAARDEMYRTHMAKAFVQALRTGNYPGAAARLPLAAVEAAAHPIMDVLVPRLKLGAFADMAELELGKLPKDATPNDVQTALGRAWDSVDNRFGEMVNDNIFWPKAVKDTGQLFFRALAWQVGTAREVGGAALDTAKFARSLTKGETPDFTHRMGYATALATIGTGMFGAAYQYLHTGTWPQSLRDYVHPLDGGTGPDGQPTRAKLPTYASDVYAFLQRPWETIGNKQADLLSGLEELAKNADFRNVQIRDPEASFGTQAKQVGAYALEKFGTPVSVGQLQRAGTTRERALEGLIGFGKAPKWVGQSPAQAMLQEFTRSGDVRTLKQEGARQDRAALRDAARTGDQEARQAILDKGTLGRQSVMQAGKSAALSSLQANFKRVTLDQALRVYDVATPAERGAVRGLLRRKVEAAHNTAPADYADLQDRLKRVWTLPYDKPPLMQALQPPEPEGAHP